MFIRLSRLRQRSHHRCTPIRLKYSSDSLKVTPGTYRAQAALTHRIQRLRSGRIAETQHRHPALVLVAVVRLAALLVWEEVQGSERAAHVVLQADFLADCLLQSPW